MKFWDFHEKPNALKNKLQDASFFVKLIKDGDLRCDSAIFDPDFWSEFSVKRLYKPFPRRFFEEIIFFLCIYYLNSLKKVW